MMDFSSICRTCLSTKSLNPLFSDEKSQNQYSLTVYLITGMKVDINDGLPQNICTECLQFLKQALVFRSQCKTAQKDLLRIKSELDKQITEDTDRDDVQTEDRTKQTQPTVNKNDNVIPNSETTNDSEYEDEPLSYLIETNCVDESLLVDNNYIINNATYSEDTESASLLKQEGDLKIEILEETPDVSNHNNPQDQIKISNEQDIPYEILSANRVACRLCQKELSIRSIDSHMTRRHPGADRRKVKCELCNAYLLKTKLNRHMGMVHKTERNRCAFCKAEFLSKDVLMEHVNNCSSKIKRRKINESGRELRECDICHKLMQKASLRMHVAVKHAGLGPVCEHCGRRFGNKFRLKEHYRAKHGYEKFKCCYCEFQSASAMSLRNHERRHRGEKPFVCETCGAKFHAAYLLTQHKQSHRTERSVKCDLCPATFKANNSLHMHKSTCHSDSVYQCSVCGRGYSCRHYVVKHMRHVHSFKGPVPIARSQDGGV